MAKAVRKLNEGVGGKSAGEEGENKQEEHQRIGPLLVAHIAHEEGEMTCNIGGELSHGHKSHHIHCSRHKGQ